MSYDLCETKPILRLRIVDWGQTCGGIPALCPVTSGLRRPVCTNKPNSRSQSCETKPMSGGPAGTEGQNVRNKAKLGRTGACGKRWSSCGGGLAGKRNVRNEPISAKLAGRSGRRRAKMCETNPIARSGAPRRCLDCGFRPPVGAGGGDNEANSRRRLAGRGRRDAGRGDECAKRTQFAPGQAGGAQAEADHAKRTQF
jgi:hypothetical protein